MVVLSSERGLYTSELSINNFDESGYSQDFDWTLWIKHASTDYVDMIYIDIIDKYHVYSAENICISGQSLSCFKRDCG